MSPSKVIHKLLKKNKFISIRRIRVWLFVNSGEKVSHRTVKQIVHNMRTKEGISIGTSFKKGEGFFLIKTLKQHEKDQAFWLRREKAARDMRIAGEKNWSRMNSRLKKHNNKLVTV